MQWEDFTGHGSLKTKIFNVLKIFVVYCLMFAFLWWFLGSLYWAIVMTAVLFLLTIFIVKLYDGFWGDDFWDIDEE